MKTNDSKEVNLATPWITTGLEEIEFWKTTKAIHFRELNENLRRVIFHYLIAYRNHGPQRRPDWNNLVITAKDDNHEIRIEEA